MIDAGVVAGAWNGIKFAKDALKLALDAKVDASSKEQVQAALDRLGTATDALFEIREELFRLQSENQQLRDALAAQREWKDIAAQYELVTAPGSAVVYRFKGSPEHYACPSCFDKKKRQPLQDRQNRHTGCFWCPECDKEFKVRKAEGAQQISRRGHDPYS